MSASRGESRRGTVTTTAPRLNEEAPEIIKVSQVSGPAAASVAKRMGKVSTKASNKKNTSVSYVNTSAFGKAASMKKISNQDRRAADARREEMAKFQAFALKGFESQTNAIAVSIRQAQEQIGKDSLERFTSFQASMSLLNKNIRAADENQKRNFIQLQAKVVETEGKVNEYREKIKQLFKDLDTKDEARFREAKLKLQEYNALILELTRDLGQKINDLEVKVNAGLEGLMDKLRDIDLAVRAGFDAARAEIELERAQLKDLLLRETNPEKLRGLQDRLRDLEKENEDVEIYVCTICGSSLHGANCAAYNNTSVRRSYTIKRRQLNKLKGYVGEGRGEGGMEAYFVEVGRGGDIATRFEDLLRSKGLI